MNRIGEKPPLIIWLYLATTALGFGLAFAPSAVHTSYSLRGLVLWAALLGALVLRVGLARRLLILGGLLVAFADMAVQGPLDAVATLRAVIELIGVALLLAPAARCYTRGRHKLSAQTPTAA